MKITNAMYLISSTKVKKARRALTEALPHFEQSEELIGGRSCGTCRSWRTAILAPGSRSLAAKRGIWSSAAIRDWPAPITTTF